jgi:hypothetical protein
MTHFVGRLDMGYWMIICRIAVAGKISIDTLGY